MNYSSNFFLLLFTANSKGIRRVTVLHRALPDLDNSEGKNIIINLIFLYFILIHHK